MARTPQVNSEGQKELEKMQDKFDAFTDQISSFDPLANKEGGEMEPQTKLSNREADKLDAPFIKPLRSIASREKFNEKYRKKWEDGWKYVKCIVENNEIVGEAIEVWTKKFAGDPAHFWKVPVNKPIYIPRLLAEQLANCKYHRLRTEDRITGGEGFVQDYGAIIVDHVVHRIDARPVGFGFTSMART